MTPNGNDFPNHAKVSADIAFDICKRMEFDNITCAYIRDLILWHGINFNAKHEENIKYLYMVKGEEFVNDLLKLCLADGLATGYATAQSNFILNFLNKLQDINDSFKKY